MSVRLRIPGPLGFWKSCGFYVNLLLTQCHIYDYQLLGCVLLSVSPQLEWHFAVTGRLIMEYMHAAPADGWAGEVGIYPHVKQWDWRSEDTPPRPTCSCQTLLLEHGSSSTRHKPRTHPISPSVRAALKEFLEQAWDQRRHPTDRAEQQSHCDKPWSAAGCNKPNNVLGWQWARSEAIIDTS